MSAPAAPPSGSEDPDRVAQFSTGKAIPVALKSLDAELSSLWRQVADRKGAGAGPVTRACLWNLVIRTAGGAAFDRAKALVDEISPSLPARVIVLSGDPRAVTSPIQAWVEANWHGGPGGRQIGSEEITLRACGDTVDDLAQVVRALVVPDVPTAAVWHGVHPAPGGSCGSALDDELLAGATRVLVAADDDEASLRALASLLEAADPFSRARIDATQVDLMSLGWLRATAWRQLLASLFDPPTPPDELRAARDLHLTCAPDRVDGALLFLGWFASRLGWKSGSRVPGKERRYVFAGGHRASIDVQGGDDALGKVEVVAPAGSYSIERVGPSLIVNTPELARKQPRHVPGDVDLWLDALGARGRDPLFLDALRVAARLAS